ncbi:hypothetical protein FEM48_Zijuj07G0171600 [Ziziphus jujuba var. spinosa]|uniref:Uncharacterized protein n=1 Tax=Ziziphus jujuba var. spinosa TaxID=714518 RepID=A0A978V5W7_ZIZJJ|nr:hypothetical protein FEM48_Zijuj07G0171600 [Ziziphus jujuba var. spinosa]
MNASNNQICKRIPNLSIFKWGDFHKVDFTSNQLEGAIPMFLFNVTALHLSRNKFSNLNCLCDVKGRASLVFLDISFNQLSGTLPDCWSSLDSLAVLNLAHNYNLSGKLPTSIGSMLSIQTLHLGNNNFRGGLPSSWKNCPRLVAFDVGENNLSGSIPSWIEESLTKLSILVLRSNHFNGNIPSNICHLQSLQVLDLSMNNISGSLPTCVGNFTEIHKVGGIHATISYLIYVPIPASSATLFMRREDKIEVVCKGVMSEFGRTLGLVKSIDLSCNMLNGEIPSEITLLIGLVSLNLSRNSLSGQIPSMIGDINSSNSKDIGELEHLKLLGNTLEGLILEAFCNMASLTYLDLSNNYLNVSIPKSLGNMTVLTHLDLFGNNLEGSYILEAFTKASLTNLDANNLKGSIPITLGNLGSTLTHLDLFEGFIPESFGYNMFMLTHISLENNQLEDPIPEAFSRLPLSLKECKVLVVMDVGHNNLSRPIPTWIGKTLPYLLILNLKSNHFYGKIPMSLRDLPHLQLLVLSINNISGSIPKCLSNFSKMRTIKTIEATAITYYYDSDQTGAPISNSGTYEDET